MSVLLTNLKLEVPEKLILYRLQFKNRRTEADDAVLGLIREVTNEALSLVDPRAVYAEFGIASRTAEEVSLTGGPVIRSAAIARLLEACDRAVLLAGTVGEDISARIREYAATDLTRAAVLDAAASEFADEVANRVQFLVRNGTGGKCSRLTYRFSPGYSDWKLSDQPVLLAALDAGRIGLSCDGSFILQPEKSVTGLIGVEPASPSCSSCPSR
jgi:5-methyltetrahydrofolate--homocysteine methyltransferase